MKKICLLECFFNSIYFCYNVIFWRLSLTDFFSRYVSILYSLSIFINFRINYSLQFVLRGKHIVHNYFNAVLVIDDLYGDNDPLLNLPPDPKCEPDPRGLGCFFMDKLKEYAEKMCQVILFISFTPL